MSPFKKILSIIALSDLKPLVDIRDNLAMSSGLLRFPVKGC